MTPEQQLDREEQIRKLEEWANEEIEFAEACASFALKLHNAHYARCIFARTAIQASERYLNIKAQLDELKRGMI